MPSDQTRSPPVRTEAEAEALPRARTAAAGPGERTYSEQQVAQILQGAARLERSQAQQKPALTLSEVEAIARESGLDPSLVRVAARSLEQVQAEKSLGARLAGAPTHRCIERVIDGELTAAHHEQLVSDLRAGLVTAAVRPPQISSVGRTLTATVREGSGLIELTLTPRDGQTHLRIDINCGPLAGAFFGGLFGGLGGALISMAIGITQANHLGAGVMALASAGVLGGAFTLARSLFTWRATALFQRMDALADKIERRVAEELARGPDLTRP